MSSGWTDIRGSCASRAPADADHRRGRFPASPARLVAALLLPLLLPLLLLPFLGGAARADLRLSATPMKLPLVLEPGGHRTGAVSVFNGGTDPVHVTVSVVDWVTTPDGCMEFGPAQPIRSAREWVRPEFEEFTLPPQGRRIVRVSASLPDSARGSYWAIVFFEGEVGGQAGRLGVGARARIGATVYLTAQGTEHRDDALTGMEVAPGTGRAPFRLKASLANRGNVYFYPAGWFQVMNAQGEVVYQDAIPLRVLLPGKETVYTLSWTPTSAGEFRLVATFDLGLETLLQGIKKFNVPDSLVSKPAITLRAVPQPLPATFTLGAPR